MILEDIIRSPWFYSSPSPLSLLFHGIIIFLVARFLQKRFTYNYKWFGSLTDSFFLVGFIVLSGDFIWMSLSGLRFLGEYPDNLNLVLSVLGRDGVGMLFCYLLQKNRFGEIISYKWHTAILYMGLIGYFGINFALAPSPAFTDWTFAIREGACLPFILQIFLMTWITGKIFTGMLIHSWFKS